jgi:ubiquinone/menaquinone biosynthesis C-methylase UbiE
VKTQSTWKEFWEAKFASTASDFESDRLTGERDDALDRLASEELFEFIDPQPGEVVFDAGCGTGGNCLLIHDRVRQIIAVDFAESAIRRGRARLSAAAATNVVMSQGDIMRTDVSDGSVDKILCMSVFHYLSDDQVRACLGSFARMLRSRGTLIIHVKNLASPYLGSLHALKRLLRVLGRRENLDERFRTFEWYARQLRAAGFEIEDFNSFSLLVLERMPAKLTHFMQRLELAHRRRFPFNTVMFRRHGADLKIRARLTV